MSKLGGRRMWPTAALARFVPHTRVCIRVCCSSLPFAAAAAAHSLAFTFPGFVMFRDAEGYKKATVDSFRIFGVNIEGVPVTTGPVHNCRTVYVENLQMRKGEEMGKAINEVIQPEYKVRQRSKKKKMTRYPTHCRYHFRDPDSGGKQATTKKTKTRNLFFKIHAEISPPHSFLFYMIFLGVWCSFLGGPRSYAAVTAQLLRLSYVTVTAQHGAVTAELRYSYGAVTMYLRRSCVTLTAQLQLSYGLVAVQLRHSYGTVTAHFRQLWCSFGTVTAQLRRTVPMQLQRSYGAVTTQLRWVLRVARYVCLVWVCWLCVCVSFVCVSASNGYMRVLDNVVVVLVMFGFCCSLSCYCLVLLMLLLMPFSFPASTYRHTLNSVATRLTQNILAQTLQNSIPGARYQTVVPRDVRT